MNSTQCSFNPRNTFSYKIKYYYYSLTKYPRMLYELIDGFIQQGYSLLTLNSESVLESIDIKNKVLKRILHPTQLLFLVFLLATFLTINNNFNKELNNTSSNSNIDYKNDTLKFILIRLFLFSTFPLIILILSLFKSNPGVIVKDKEIENYISKKTAQLEKCKPCNTLRVLRSNHCVICNHCIAKFELHSMWLCKDIGAGNAFIYALFLVNMNFYLLIAQVICFFATFVYQEFNGKEFLSLFWFIALCYINNKNIRFCSKFIKGMNTNITYYEDSNYFRFPYLWGHFNRRFFNPFDKGSLIANWKDVYSSYSNSVNSKVRLLINTTRHSENQRKNNDMNNKIEEDDYNKDEDLLMETDNEIIENKDKSIIKSECTNKSSATNDNNYEDDFDIEISEVNENKDSNCSNTKSLKVTKPLKTETDNFNSENNFFKNSIYNNKSKNNGSNTNNTNNSNSPKVQISNNFKTRNTSNNNMSNNSSHSNHSHKTIYEKVVFSNNHPISFIVSDETLCDILITSSEGNIYQPYQQYNPLTSESINWVKLRLYSIMDIINSPMRQSLIMNLTQMQNMQNIQRNVGNDNNNNNNSSDNTNTNFINEDTSMINAANEKKDENNLLINARTDLISYNIISKSNSNNTCTNYNNTYINENNKDLIIPIINNNKEIDNTYGASDEDNTLFDDLNNEI